MTWWWILLVLPVLWIGIDMVAGIRERRKPSSEYDGTHRCDDFSVLVPIYGSTSYLENVDYLKNYSGRVILCTTSGETNDFYEQLDVIADRNGFTVFRSSYAAPTSDRKRMTGGTIRDRVIRDALVSAVTSPYVVCLDADTITAENLAHLVGELDHRGGDLASIRLVPQRNGPLVVQLQRHEYRQSMRMRFLVPWLVSGACHVGTTAALRHIMQCHSLFFQGNDVETGLLGEQLGYRITHIPFEVNTNVPATWGAWLRQRLAWSGGEFRLFIANIRYVLRHPFLWLYGAVLTIGMVGPRWWSVTAPTITLLGIAALYWAMVMWLHWKHRNRWILLMPLYSLVNSLILTPIGILWYFVMAVPERNFGFIRPKITQAQLRPLSPRHSTVQGSRI